MKFQRRGRAWEIDDISGKKEGTRKGIKENFKLSQKSVVSIKLIIYEEMKGLGKPRTLVSLLF